MHDLVKIRVRPYYIYQCDLSEGISHFRAPISKGLEIMEGLRGHTSGYAVPTEDPIICIKKEIASKKQSHVLQIAQKEQEPCFQGLAHCLSQLKKVFVQHVS
jgi:lysine 2,3-aminomutase